MSVILSVAVLLVATPATPAPPLACSPDPPGASDPAADEAFIREAETDWAASIAKNEAAFLRGVASDDFSGVFDGQVVNRAELIAGAEKRRDGDASDTLDVVRVHLFGSTAIAEGSEHWSDRTPPRRTRIVWSDAWVRCGGRWRLKTSIAVSDPAE